MLLIILTFEKQGVSAARVLFVYGLFSISRGTRDRSCANRGAVLPIRGCISGRGFRVWGICFDRPPPYSFGF